MSPERMKALHRLLIDALNNHSCEGVEEIFHDPYTVHEGWNNPDGTERCYTVSHKMLKESRRKGIPGLPNKRQTIQMQIAEGDLVFTYCVATATHSGTWLGIPASGKKLTYENLYISRFRDGKIAEHWVILDAFGMLRQIGKL